MTHFSKLESVLADPECEFTSQLRINYNLIKCLLDGFSLLAKENLSKTPSEMLKRKAQGRLWSMITPRRQMPSISRKYRYLKTAWVPVTWAICCEYYLHFHNYGIKQQKDKVMCLIAAPNSGKTSLFTPMTRIIPARYFFCSLLMHLWYVLVAAVLCWLLLFSPP